MEKIKVLTSVVSVRWMCFWRRGCSALGCQGIISSRGEPGPSALRVAHLLACPEESFPILVAAEVTGGDRLCHRPSVDKPVENFLSVDPPHKPKCERVHVYRGQTKKVKKSCPPENTRGLCQKDLIDAHLSEYLFSKCQSIKLKMLFKPKIPSLNSIVRVEPRYYFEDMAGDLQPVV